MTTTPVAFPPQSPLGRFSFPVLALFLGLCFALTRGGGPPALLTALSGVLALGYLPGLGLSLWAENRRGWWGSWILPLILSPVAVTFTGLILVWSGFSLDAAGMGIVFLAVLAVVFAPPPSREIEHWAVSVETPGVFRVRADRHQVLGLAGAIVLLVGLALLRCSWLRDTGEVLRQAAVVTGIEVRGLPPPEPFLAGATRQAAWAFEVYLAILRAATRLDLAGLLAGGSLVAAVAVVFAAYRLLALLALSHAQRLWGVVFLFFSMNGAFWFLMPAQAVLHAQVGGGLVHRVLGRVPLNEGVSAVALAGLPPETAFFLERFLTAGPLTLGLLYMLLFAAAAVAGLGESRRQGSVFAVVGAAGMLFFHFELALTVFAVSLAALPLFWLTGRVSPLRGPGREFTGIVFPVAVSLLITAPYLASLEPAQWLRLLGARLSALHAAWLLGAVLPALVVAAPVFVRFLGAAEARRQAWGVWTAAALAAGCFVVFPGREGREVPVYVAYLPLALTAGSTVPGLWARTRGAARVLLVAGLALVLLPNTLLGLCGYALVPAPRGLGADLVQAEEWLEDQTPPGAVIVDTAPDLTLMAGRTLLYAEDAVTAGWRGIDLGMRRRAFRLLCAGGAPGPAERRHLLALGAPLFVVRRFTVAPDSAFAPSLPPADPAEYTVRFQGRGVEILEWTPPPGPEPGP